MKPLQGNLDFFLIRASRGPFRLKHKTQGPSHIHIPKGKLLLRCLWKDGLPLHSKTGNQHSSPDDMEGMGFLELRQEPGVYSRVTAGMSIRNSSLFIEVRNLSRYEVQLRNVN